MRDHQFDLVSLLVGRSRLETSAPTRFPALTKPTTASSVASSRQRDDKCAGSPRKREGRIHGETIRILSPFWCHLWRGEMKSFASFFFFFFFFVKARCCFFPRTHARTRARAKRLYSVGALRRHSRKPSLPPSLPPPSARSWLFYYSTTTIPYLLPSRPFLPFPVCGILCGCCAALQPRLQERVSCGSCLNFSGRHRGSQYHFASCFDFH